jgi:hypothetical protein
MPFISSARGSYGPQGKKVIKGPLAPVWTTSGTLTGATAAAYSYQLVATDDSGDAPTYSLLSGALPTGMSLSSSGLISGTATGASASYSFVVRATDANGRFTDSSTLTIVATLGPSWITTGTQANVNQTFASGQSGTYGVTFYRNWAYPSDSSSLRKVDAGTGSNGSLITSSYVGNRQMCTWGRSIMFPNLNAAKASMSTTNITRMQVDNNGNNIGIASVSSPVSYGGMYTTNNPYFFCLAGGSSNGTTLYFIQPTTQDRNDGYYRGAGTSKAVTVSGGNFNDSYNACGGFLDVTTGYLYANRWNGGSGSYQFWQYSGSLSHLQGTDVNAITGQFNFGGQVGSSTTIGAGADPWNGYCGSAVHGANIFYSQTMGKINFPY